MDKKYTFIKLEDAKALNSRAKANELLEVKIEPDEFNYNASRDLKHRFNEDIKQIKKEKIYQSLKKLQYEMVNAKVLDVERDFYRIDINKNVITMLPKE